MWFMRYVCVLNCSLENYQFQYIKLKSISFVLNQFGSYNYNQFNLKMSEHSESKASMHPSGYDREAASGGDRASRYGGGDHTLGDNPFSIP